MPSERAVGVDDDGGVVIDARGAALEQRRDDDHAQFGGQAAQRLGGGAGDGLGQIEEGGVFVAAEILGAEEFLEADDLRAAGGGFADAPFGFGEILVGVEGAGHLDEADAEFVGRHFSILAGAARFARWW